MTDEQLRILMTKIDWVLSHSYEGADVRGIYLSEVLEIAEALKELRELRTRVHALRDERDELAARIANALA